MQSFLQKLVKNEIVHLLSYPPFLYFSLSVFLSQVAFNMLSVVLIFLVFHLTTSNFAVSILLFAILIPQIFISFIGGVIADTSNKKTILIIGNILRAVVLLFLFLNYESVSLVYFVTLAVSIVTQFYVPAESPMIPSLVKREQLVAANSIFGISFFGSVLIGYVFAGPAISILGRADVFILLALLFSGASLFAFLIPGRKIEVVKKKIDTVEIKRSIKLELKESLSLVRKTKLVGEAFFLLTFSQVTIFILATLIPGYAKSILQVPAEDLSVILFAPAAVGMFISGLAIGGVLGNVSKSKLMNTGVFISGVVLVLLPFTSRIFAQSFIPTINSILPNFLDLTILNFVIVIAFFAGFANALIFIPSQAIIQEVVPDNFRSKIYGLLYALIGIFSLFPILVAGGLADVIGVGNVFMILGSAIVIVGFIRERVIVASLISLIKKR